MPIESSPTPSHPPAPHPPEPLQSEANSLFFTADGLRPGWGLLLFAILYYALQTTLVTATSLLRPAPQPPGAEPSFSPAETLWSDGLNTLAVLLTTFLMSRIELRPLAAYGLAARRVLARAGAGAATGIAALSLLVWAMHSAHVLVFDARLLTGPAIFVSAVRWITAFLCVALFEEIFFRGYLQATLTRALAAVYNLLGAPHPQGAGFWTSALLLSFGFGFVHTTNPGESPVGVFAAGLIGLVFCLSLWRTGSLWWAIGFHLAWDWAESFLFGVYDSGILSRGRLFDTHPQGAILLSGGLTGPEGSLLILPILVGIAAILLITVPRKEPDPPGRPDKDHAV